jgi:hypothetical protein
MASFTTGTRLNTSGGAFPASSTQTRPQQQRRRNSRNANGAAAGGPAAFHGFGLAQSDSGGDDDAAIPQIPISAVSLLLQSVARDVAANLHELKWRVLATVDVPLMEPEMQALETRQLPPAAMAVAMAQSDAVNDAVTPHLHRIAAAIAAQGARDADADDDDDTSPNGVGNMGAATRDKSPGVGAPSTRPVGSGAAGGTADASDGTEAEGVVREAAAAVRARLQTSFRFAAEEVALRFAAERDTRDQKTLPNEQLTLAIATQRAAMDELIRERDAALAQVARLESEAQTLERRVIVRERPRCAFAVV